MKPHDELDEEMRSHLAHRTDDLVRGGMNRADAERQARLEFGGVEGYKEEVRAANQGGPLRRLPGMLVRDARIGARRLIRTPLFAAFAVVSLAIGVSVPTIVYALVNATLWRPVGVADPATLAVVVSQVPGGEVWQSAIARNDLPDLSTDRTGLGALAWSESLYATFTGADVAVDVAVETASGGFFSALGLAPALGRFIQPDDDRADAAPVVVLSHRAWRAGFASSPLVIGRSVRVQDRVAQIIGVAPASFDGFALGRPSRLRVWIPSAVAPTLGASKASLTSNQASLTVLGRLTPGDSIARASTTLAALGTALDRTAPRVSAPTPSTPSRPQPRSWGASSIADLEARLSATVSPIAFAILGVGFLVLLVACSNLTNLWLARGTARRHEFAIRRALGASRGRLIAELLAESAWIAVGGLALSMLLLRALVVLTTIDLPVANQQVFALAPEVDLRVLSFVATATVASVTLFGLQPAFQLTRTSDRAALNQAGYSVIGASRGQWRLISWQVAIAFGFLVIAATAVRYVIAYSRDDSGLDLDRVSIGTSAFLAPRWDATSATIAEESIVAQLRLQPGVESVSASFGLPYGIQTTPLVTVTTRPAQPALSMLRVSATPELFRTLGIAIERGRGFDARDTVSSPAVGVLSRKAAMLLFGTADVVGRPMTVSMAGAASAASVPVSVIGVAADTDVQSRGNRDDGLLYVPFTQAFGRGVTFAVRAKDAATGVSALRNALVQSKVEVTMSGVGAAEELLAPALPITRLASALTLGLGGLTLLLSMIGLHGVLSQALASRTREMALRLALGATSTQVSWLALRQGLRPVVSGLAVGLIAGTLVRAFLRGRFTLDIGLVDPLAVFAIPFVFILVAWLACLWPARRVARIDPNAALREG